jgi:hypothetical protein
MKEQGSLPVSRIVPVSLDVTQLLDAFALGPYIEIVVTGLPKNTGGSGDMPILGKDSGLSYFHRIALTVSRRDIARR